MIAAGGVVTWIFLTDGVRDAAFSLSRDIQPLYLEQIGGLNTQQIGLVFSIFSISMLATPLISGRLSDKFGERVPISIGFFLIFVGFCIFLVAGGFYLFALVWVVSGLGVGLLSPAYSSLISKVIPHDRLGAFHGLFYGSMGLIALPAPYLGTLMWEKIGPRSPFMVTAAFVLLSIIPIWLKFKVPEKDDPEVTDHTASESSTS
jgi:MFS family permease